MKLAAIALFLAGSLLSSGCAVGVRGPRHAAHPAYLHALEDLRFARAHLEQTEVNNRQTQWDANVSIREIDAAIADVKEAAIEDGKDPRAANSVDLHLDWPGRMHRALELLRRARGECTHEEINVEARELQRRALEHIDGAIHFVEQGIADNHW